MAVAGNSQGILVSTKTSREEWEYMTNKKLDVVGTKITVVSRANQDYLSLTDMLKAKDGDFFISDWLRNRNTIRPVPN